MIKSGITYSFARPTAGKRQEIEYTGGEELALDDLFREERGGNASEQDALDRLFGENDSGSKPSSKSQDDLDKLFAVEQASGETKAAGADETGSRPYESGDVQEFLQKIATLEKTIDNKSLEIDQLKNQVEENERTIAGLTRQMAGDFTGIDRGMTSLSSFKANYEKGLEAFHLKNYKEAISTFTSLLNSDPDNRLASNCQYWIGECYNAMGEYRSAIEAFNAVLRYSQSPKFDDALIMNGLCYMKVGDRISAREKFQQLLNRFPKSEYVPKAMRYLGSL